MTCSPRAKSQTVTGACVNTEERFCVWILAYAARKVAEFGGKPSAKELQNVFNKITGFRGEDGRSLCLKNRSNDIRKCLFWPIRKAEKHHVVVELFNLNGQFISDDTSRRKTRANPVYFWLTESLGSLRRLSLVLLQNPRGTKSPSSKKDSFIFLVPLVGGSENSPVLKMSHFLSAIPGEMEIGSNSKPRIRGSPCKSLLNEILAPKSTFPNQTSRSLFAHVNRLRSAVVASSRRSRQSILGWYPSHPDPIYPALTCGAKFLFPSLVLLFFATITM